MDYAPPRDGINLAVTNYDKTYAKASTTMTKTSPDAGTTPAIEPAAKAPLLDPVAFEIFAKAAKLAVAEGLARRALMALTPASKAKH